jgi:signal transduction histidine kinase
MRVMIEKDAKDTKNYSRLLTIIIYLFMNMPGQVTWALMGRDSPDLLHAGILWIFILSFFFLLLEILEFSLRHYRFERDSIPRGLLVLRILLLAVACYLTELAPTHILYTPYFSLLFFYVYHAFPFRISLSLFILSLAVNIGRMLFIYLFHVPDGDSNLQAVLMYKIPVMVICYLFAHIWSQERKTLDDNRALIRDLNGKEAELKGLLSDIERTATLKERTRLARDIHDSVGHALMVVQIQLNKAAAYADIDTAETKSAVEEARKTAADATRDIRASLDILNSHERLSSISEAVPGLIKPLRERDILVSCRVMGNEKDYNHMVLMGIYRMVQEGVTNILRHSEAKGVKLDIHFGEHYVDASLKDDGVGFNPEQSAGRDDHYGLTGLSRRLEMAGGHLEIVTEPGRGCELRVRLMKDPVRLAGEYDG